MSATRKKYIGILAVFLLVLILIIVLATRIGGSSSDQEETVPVDLNAGLDYLRALEQQDPAQVDEVLKEQLEQKMIEMREERLQQLESGEVSVWTLFEDYVLLGDSRAVGFSYYGFLPEERVLAEGGATIRNLKERIPEVAALNPSMVFLCFGLNDVSIGFWNTPEEYVTEFEETIREIQSQIPGVKIYVNSILPAHDPAFDTAPVWRDIPEYSAAVEEMCQNIENCYYVDNDAIAEKYYDLWDVDGIHLQKAFYDHWASNMMVEVFSPDLS
ncbi:MAG: GDSL-type esterase/lipase family protein [Oscillospiraceae bacterium]|nr:GDSL-type esterase/lipase family protein [Oscillospiraceae bacterium]